MTTHGLSGVGMYVTEKPRVAADLSIHDCWDGLIKVADFAGPGNNDEGSTGMEQQQAEPARQLSRYRRLLISLSNAGVDALNATSWPALAMRLWRSYVMVHGIAEALRVGASGFTTGLSIGKTLIEEQASLLNNVVGYTSSLLGSPYAEMVWCQAVGALFVGMLSELVYTSILGLLGGLAY
eukprot:gene750-1055_t